jgi:hypothetical protein
VFIIIDLAVLFLRGRYWIGVWPETGTAALAPAYLLGLVGAGAAAWAAAAPARHGLEEQLRAARVHPMLSDAYRLGATFVVVLLPYLIGQAVAFAVTARTFPPGVHIWLGYAVMGVFVLSTAVAVGWACGKMLGPVFAALTAVLAFLFLTTSLARAGFVIISGRPEVAVDPVALALRLGAIAVLFLVLLWVSPPGAQRREKRKALALVPAVLPLVAVMASTSAVVERDPPGEREVCINGMTALCIWPEHEKYIPGLRDINARIALLPDVFDPPPRINESGLHKTWHAGRDGDVVLREEGPPFFDIIEGSPWSYAGSIGTAINASTFGFQDFRTCNWDSLTTADQLRLSAVDAWLEAYLVGDGSPDYQTSAPAQLQEAWLKGRAIADGPQAEQLRWAEREVRDLRGRYCHNGR